MTLLLDTYGLTGNPCLPVEVGSGLASIVRQRYWPGTRGLVQNPGICLSFLILQSGFLGQFAFLKPDPVSWTLRPMGVLGIPCSAVSFDTIA